MKPQIKKGQINQWPKEKGQKYKKKRSTRPAAELCPFKFSKIFNNLIAHVTVLCSKKLNITKIDSGLSNNICTCDKQV
jgi:hypothetical protein